MDRRRINSTLLILDNEWRICDDFTVVDITVPMQIKQPNIPPLSRLCDRTSGLVNWLWLGI